MISLDNFFILVYYILVEFFGECVDNSEINP